VVVMMMATSTLARTPAMVTTAMAVTVVATVVAVESSAAVPYFAYLTSPR
jgi:hypothetical protein